MLLAISGRVEVHRGQGLVGTRRRKGEDGSLHLRSVRGREHQREEVRHHLDSYARRREARVFTEAVRLQTLLGRFRK